MPTTIPGFTGSTEFDLPLECTYDFEVAAAKYLHALAGRGDPAAAPFFRHGVHPGRGGILRPNRSPGTLEATYRLPVSVWRGVMDQYFPNSGWLRVRRDTLDRLQRFKARRPCPPGIRPLSVLLKHAGEDRP